MADMYRHAFAARLDDHTEFTGDPDDGGHWYRTRAELTAQRVLAGLTGAHPVSAYMEDAAGFTHVGAIDFDLDDGWDRALAVAGLLSAAGAFPYTERSRRGAHLWVVADAQIPGPAMRIALRWAAETAHPGAGSDPKVEILPKKIIQRGPDTVGSALRMPMMAHPRTGIRYPLCGPDGQPIGGRIAEIVAAVELTPSALLTDIAAAAPVPVSEAVVSLWMRRPAMPAGDVLVVLAGAGLEARPGRSVRCPLHDDRHASLNISHDGERVWCKAPSCPAYNNGRGLGADQLLKELHRGHD